MSTASLSLPILRTELFTREQLEVHAKAIAGRHLLSTVAGPDHLLPRLQDNERTIHEVYELIYAAAAGGRRLSPAGEWLVDNYYVIQDQIRIARLHLPKRYSRQLPQLAAGPAAGWPRVYHIALELITHLDARLDLDHVTGFIAAYQTTAALKLGELWAVPIMLRLALIEYIRHIAERIVQGRRDRNLAADWAEQLLSTAQTEPGKVIMVLADMARSDPPLSSAFVSEFSRLLQGQHPAISVPLTWMEQRLADQALTLEHLLHAETQMQAAKQVSIGNSIGGLRFLGAVDWRTFVENLSVVEKILRRDPANVYPTMDFPTRDRYRHVVESLAKYSQSASEQEVATRAVALAVESQSEHGPANRSAHVGYYLVDKGVQRLESFIRPRNPLRARLTRSVLRAPLLVYSGLAFGIMAVVLAPLVYLFWSWRLPLWQLAISAFALLLIGSQLGVAFANWLVALIVPPRRLPRLDFSHGIPENCRTLVVVPTMLSSPAMVTELLESLEVRFLANQDPQVFFALLTDFPDAAQETLPEDAALVTAAQAGIEALNTKYAATQRNAFYLFHRPRRWNPSEGCWMGYERKRGKLADLNALLRGGPATPFSTTVGELAALSSVRFVITLDTDTELPRDAARELIATLAHPLVQPVFNEKLGRVVEGYGILQPRLATRLTSAGQTWFARLFAGDPGIDPYTRLVSDVYQDLFQEGSYIGKGIYDVAAFEQALGGRFPENTILSHDLIEGCYARAGLVSDVQFYEDFPSSYIVDAARRHRWMRGDWQIFPWLFSYPPTPAKTRARNTLSTLSHWKIFDNLRRSLVPAALLFLLLVGWASPMPALVTGLLLAVVFLPALFSTLVDVFRRSPEVTFLLHSWTVARRFGTQLLQQILFIAFLPYESCVSLDAALRTLWRRFFSHRHLLEWQTIHDAQRRARGHLTGFAAKMLSAPLLSIAVAGVLWYGGLAPFGPALPLLAIWLISPGIAWWLSRPVHEHTARLEPVQRNLLRVVARRTWAFFEEFVNADNHFLPPDNHQEQPTVVTAHRTSPTNIGMALGSMLSAHDFGYVPAGGVLARVGRTFATLDGLERFRGHFYNWYDTHSLQPLPEPYVSTVDSGNLVAMFYVLRQGLLEIPTQPVLAPRVFPGLQDTLLVIQDELNHPSRRDNPAIAHAFALVDEILDDLERPPEALRSRFELLQRIRSRGESLSQSFSGGADEGLAFALGLFNRQCDEICRESADLIGWLTQLPSQDNSPSTPQRENVADILANFEKNPTLHALATLDQSLIHPLDALLGERSGANHPSSGRSQWMNLRDAIAHAAKRAADICTQAEDLAARSRDFAQAADFRFLFDAVRKHLSIGFRVTERRLDSGYYDLLASEARVASYVAIAQGQLPQEHWFSLGRRLTVVDGRPVLLSWSGSMFEYLMPALLMPHYPQTLLERSNNAAVNAQIHYGRERNIPWGISESCYNATDAQLNYQYRSFGVPGLGFKRGLADDLVIAPYATVMAVPSYAEEACANLLRLKAEGALSNFGFYEAIDYTPRRVPSGRKFAIVYCYMAHHQGMALLSLAEQMLGRPMQRRFLAEPVLRSVEQLLQERVPDTPRIQQRTEEPARPQAQSAASEIPVRIYSSPDTPTPEVQLLSNARYHVMITASGGGYSRWTDLAMTRWREDPTRDCWGSFCYIRDLESREFWSATHQPTLKPADSYQARFQHAHAEFDRLDHDINTRLVVSVAAEDDAEVRRLTLTNRSNRRRLIEVTSYAEVVLAPQAADATHPAFSNLFVQTELLPERRAILCTRRPRSHAETPPWLFHVLAVQGAAAGNVSFETDRRKFTGRCQRLTSPAALNVTRLSNSQGSVLDPIIAIRQSFLLEPESSVSFSFITGVAPTREAAMSLVAKYHDYRLAERVFEMAWTHNQVTRRHLNITAADAELFGCLAGSMIYPSRLHRADPAILAKNQRPQSALWGYGISGDLPIMLLRLGDAASIELARKVIQAHAYWRSKGLIVDLVIWNEDQSGYRQNLQDQITGIINASPDTHAIDRPGGIFVRKLEQISYEDQILFQTMARVVISDRNGAFADQAVRRPHFIAEAPRLHPSQRRELPKPSASPPRNLLFFNGHGGFTQDGREYIITLTDEKPTPAPWVNVLANANFGTVVSESGSAYTWAENAHEYRLTPWSNDPVTDAGGEALYLRDDVSGEFWSPSPFPAVGRQPYTCRHGMGYSVFEHTELGIRSELTVFVAVDAPVKFAVLKLYNESGRSRHLSVAAYWEWVLSELRNKSLLHTVTSVDSVTKAIFAHNPFNSDFPGRVAFATISDSTHSFTGDRAEFIGRNGTLANPAALGRIRLSGRMGAGLDACAAIQSAIELPDQDQHEVVFILGAGKNIDEARHLVQRHRGVHAAREALAKVWDYWNRTLSALRVETPDPSVNLLVNVWLPYQTLVSRLWARSGFYQSGGAFGFRDQLQDSMALIHHVPGLFREHLLLCASRQFREGDVQHWWHPPTGRGVRTHFSDDFLWLPLAVCRYVKITGDTGVLDEKIHFLEGRPVKPEEDAYYDQPIRLDDTGTLYQHCVRAIEHGLRFGEHGLPLMGCGDWNDGMNLVGKDGKGESVWLAFFLYDLLKQFAQLAESRGDLSVFRRCLIEAQQLNENIERHGWDGRWYRRAYFDNGEPLGSATNAECQIDSLPQSWAVISGVGSDERRQQAMAAVDELLVKRDAGIIQLFEPPFDKSPLDPGYIKGYTPGVRENGGQYTHAAVWAIMAFALNGDTPRAWELLSLVNPIHHGDTSGKISTYKVEPYVVAADVYAVPPHTGRGGWTWYTGSAGWLHRLIVETLLGFECTVDHIQFTPRIPDSWPGFKIHYRYRETLFHIEIVGADVPVERIILDGAVQPNGSLQLVDDHKEHQVRVELPKTRSPSPGVPAVKK